MWTISTNLKENKLIGRRSVDITKINARNVYYANKLPMRRGLVSFATHS